MIWDEIVAIVRKRFCSFTRPGLHLQGHKVYCLEPAWWWRMPNENDINLLIVWDKSVNLETQIMDLDRWHVTTEEDKKADDWYLIE